MSSQITGPTLKHLEKTESLAGSIRTHRPTANASLAELPPEIFPPAGGEDPAAPDWNLLQDWNLAALEASAAEVRQTDQEHRENLVWLAQLRIDRKAQLSKLQTGHGALRGSFVGTYGKKSLALVGLDGRAARAILAAREQLREVITRMRDPELAKGLPEPRAGQSPIDLVSLADAREADIDRYDKTNAELEGLRKHTVESRLRRMEARARNRRVYANVARIQEGLYRLAELDELADSIRFPVRSPRKKTEEPVEPQPEPQAGEPQPEPTSGEEDQDTPPTL